MRGKSNQIQYSDETKVRLIEVAWFFNHLISWRRGKVVVSRGALPPSRTRARIHPANLLYYERLRHVIPGYRGMTVPAMDLQ